MVKPTLAFVMPIYGPVDSQVYLSHMAAITKATDVFDIKFIMVTDKMMLHTASNEILKSMIELQVDYIFWTEMDMIIPSDTITRLYTHGKDITCGVYFLRDDPKQPCLYRWSKDIGKTEYEFTPVTMFPEHTLFQVDACGMGCVLLKREAVQKVPYPWFDWRQHGYGQDMYFYAKVKEAGIEVWCDGSVQCEQQGFKTTTSIEDYRKALRENKIQHQCIIGG